MAGRAGRRLGIDCDAVSILYVGNAKSENTGCNLHSQNTTRIQYVINCKHRLSGCVSITTCLLTYSHDLLNFSHAPPLRHQRQHRRRGSRQRRHAQHSRRKRPALSSSRLRLRRAHRSRRALRFDRLDTVVATQRGLQSLT